MRKNQCTAGSLIICITLWHLLRGLRGWNVLYGGDLEKSCTMMCLPASKFWLSIYLFCPHLAPSSIPISYKKHLTLLKLGAHTNLLKIRSIYVNIPSSAVKNLRLLCQNFQKGSHIRWRWRYDVAPSSCACASHFPSTFFRSGGSTFLGSGGGGGGMTRAYEALWGRYQTDILNSTFCSISKDHLDTKTMFIPYSYQKL